MNTSPLRTLLLRNLLFFITLLIPAVSQAGFDLSNCGGRFHRENDSHRIATDKVKHFGASAGAGLLLNLVDRKHDLGLGLAGRIGINAGLAFGNELLAGYCPMSPGHGYSQPDLNFSLAGVAAGELISELVYRSASDKRFAPIIAIRIGKDRDVNGITANKIWVGAMFPLH